VVESAIDQVSGQKERVDATKGAMLERISRLVTDIKKQVQSMSPILEELRRVRPGSLACVQLCWMPSGAVSDAIGC
jgi:hypothetical protein